MHPLNRLHLNNLRAVESVARSGSLRAAAEEMGISPGAVSQQVARAEETVGQKLFDRRPGGMVPAPGTEEFFRLLTSGFRQLSAAAELGRRDRGQELRISCAPIFAARWLIWRLPAFYRSFPDLKVRLDSQVSLADPNDGNTDFAIRIGRGPYPDLRAQSLFAMRIVPVCSPELARTIVSQQDFASVPIIRDTNAMYTWDDWLVPEGAGGLVLRDGPEFSEASLCLDAAMSGAGVFLSFETLCRDALDQGRVAAPIPRFHRTDLRYWLISAGEMSLSPAQRLFRKWLLEATGREGLGHRAVGDPPPPPQPGGVTPVA
ncbi:LysR substrate-binding domain-containing protein [Pseudooceanicola sp. HF7]|uniref:LysR substrate-binding domain-containing protein n=1 Tax=Pseudooceanicola sp. HF7 TaxID=2721560 RepID=UPI001430E46C|nr:LysR substrate-binding domain-containing protein [Pseudooceanicola sp. HF7]NIZ11285.1 LysR family transcriptional regulator [Pseudooceanicola sp. HF7]